MYWRALWRLLPSGQQQQWKTWMGQSITDLYWRKHTVPKCMASSQHAALSYFHSLRAGTSATIKDCLETEGPMKLCLIHICLPSCCSPALSLSDPNTSQPIGTHSACYLDQIISLLLVHWRTVPSRNMCGTWFQSVVWWACLNLRFPQGRGHLHSRKLTFTNSYRGTWTNWIHLKITPREMCTPNVHNTPFKHKKTGSCLLALSQILGPLAQYCRYWPTAADCGF